MLLILVVCGLSVPARATNNGPAAFLRKIDRQLCISFKSLKCNRHKRHTPVAPKTKPTIEKPLTPPTSVLAPVTSEPAAKLSLQPEIPKQIKAPPVLPPDKPHKAKPTPPILIPAEPSAPVTAENPTDSACVATLKSMHVDFESVGQPSGSPSCIVVRPVQLKSVSINGVVLQLPDHPILNCQFAVQFVSWLQDLGGPVAAAKEGFALTQFHTGPGYQCRGRNGDASAKISEHGHGNAVDVERIKFSDGRVFLVHDALDPTSPAYETLKAIRASACTRFTTVLGPGSNEAHREHFHFDNGVHGKSGTYKICE